MKKTYIQPSVKAIEIHMNQGLLTASNEQTLRSGSATEWGSREGSFWDDED